MIEWSSFNSYTTTIEKTNQQAQILNLQDLILDIDLLFYPKKRLKPVSVNDSSRIGSIKNINIWSKNLI